MRRFAVFGVAIIAFLCCNCVFGGESVYLRNAIDGSIVIEGNPEVNREITIVFTFMLKPEGPFFRQMKEFEKQFAERAAKGDTSAAMAIRGWAERIDHANLLPDTNVEYLGKPEWTGQLKPLQQYEITVKARLRYKMATQISGVVETYCGTAAFPSPCMTANFFVSDTLFRGAETVDKPVAAKPDTIWKNGHPIIIAPANYPILRIDSIPPVKKIEEPVPPHRQPEKKTISSVSTRRGINAMEETADSYLVTGRFFNVYIPHDTMPAAYMRYYVAYVSLGSWYIDFEVTTGADGAFDFYTANSHIAVVEVSGNEAAPVCWSDSHRLEGGGALIPYQFGVEITNPNFDDIDIPLSFTTNTAYPAPYHIAQAIRSGYWEFYGNTGLVQDPVWVYWDSLNTQYLNSFCGRFEVAGLPMIFINNRNGGDKDWD